MRVLAAAGLFGGSAVESISCKELSNVSSDVLQFVGKGQHWNVPILAWIPAAFHGRFAVLPLLC